MAENFNVVEQFGIDVFNEETMKQRLPKNVFKALKKTIAEGKQLYNSISRELNEAKKSPISIEKTFSTKSSNALNETTIYNKSTEDNPALDLMNRMNNLYK